MKGNLFTINYFQYGVLDWPDKKQKLLEIVDMDSMIKNDKQTFYSDREADQEKYKRAFRELFLTELDLFKAEAELSKIDIKNIWCVKYAKGDFHAVHNHSGMGYSGILYLEYDDNEHDGTWFIDPMNNPVTDRTGYSKPAVWEGCITIVPSNLLHFTFPNNSEKIRSIIGFDLTV